MVYFCVDVGGTKTALAFYGADGEELFYRKFATEPERGAHDLVKRIYRAACEFPRLSEAEYGVVASPGPLDIKSGTLINVVTMRWKNVPLTEILKETFSFPFYLLNDCDAGAYGVWRYGGYSNRKSLAYISVSTGIGGGLVVEGKPYMGRGNAANFGHVRVSGTNRTCGCGKTDCLELYASGSGIERLYRERTGKTLSCAQIEHVANAGDAAAKELFHTAGCKLAEAVKSVIAVADPEIFVFGGSVCRAGELLFSSFRESCPEAEIGFAEESGKQVLRGALAYGILLQKKKKIKRG